MKKKKTGIEESKKKRVSNNRIVGYYSSSFISGTLNGKIVMKSGDNRCCFKVVDARLD